MREATALPHADYTSRIPEYNYVTKQGNWSRDRSNIDMVVIHTMDGYLMGTLSWFSRPTTVASAHYGVGYDGQIHEYVKENCTAFHASDWEVNKRSIGIEHEDMDRPNDPRPDALYLSSAKLVYDICKHYGIPIDRGHIRKHSEIKDTKPCPSALDIDRIVRMAQELDRPAPAPTPPTPPADPFTDAFKNYIVGEFSRRSKYGNLEGMCRSLFELGDKYNELLANYSKPVVVEQDYLVDVVAKAKAFEKGPQMDFKGSLPFFQNGNQGNSLPDSGNGQNGASQSGESIWYGDVENAFNKLFSMFKFKKEVQPQ